MARPPKQGIDYAGWDVDIFENDPKIDTLIEAQGWLGFSVYFYLCQKAYASNGYYYPWSYDNSATTARRMGGGIRSETVKQTVDVCLRIGLFDRRLFDLGGVLTSRGIQRRFAHVVKNQRRKRKTVESEYWLLEAAETEGFGIVIEENHLLGANGGLLGANDKSGGTKPSDDTDSEKRLLGANGGLLGANGGLLGANGGLLRSKCHESKGKESKVKDSTGEGGEYRAHAREETPTPPTQGPTTPLSYWENERQDIQTLIEARKFDPKLEYALKDWMQYKDEMGQPYHSSGANALIVSVAIKADTIGVDAVCDAIRESMANQWRSIVFDRVEERLKKQQPKTGVGGYDWDAIRRALDDDD